MAYTTIADLSANTEYTAGTYYMDANHNANGYTLTLNCNAGDIIIKRNGDVYWTNAGSVLTTNSGTYKVYFTVKDDDTVGETISGSSGSPAVSGGSWNNAVSFSSIISFKNWEIRWVDNKKFLVNTNATTSSYFEKIVWKDCDYSSVYVATLQCRGSCERLLFDDTNTMTGTAGLVYHEGVVQLQYIKVADANTSSSIVFCNYLALLNFKYIYVKNAGTGFGLYVNDNRANQTFTHCRTSIYSGGSGSYLIKVMNCVFTDHATGIYSNSGANQYLIDIMAFNCVFKSLTTQAFLYNASRGYIRGIRNCIFDSNAKLVNGTPGFALGSVIKNNGYYNNTSETGWTRGVYDETISAPSWGNFPNGTLHTDWVTYGPGDGWYTTQTITTGGDTNSFLGIAHATQSHTGTTETATTQRIGLAPVFSTLA